MKNFRAYRYYLQLVLLLLLSVKGFANFQNEKISLNAKNMSMFEAFSILESKYSFIVAYDQTKVNDKLKLNVSIHDLSIEKAMSKLLEKTNYDAKIVDNQIIIKIKAKPTKAQTTAKEEKKKFTGTILDDKGKPVPFCNVVVENTTIGVVADLNGKYSLEYKGKMPINIIFSCMGYKKKVIKVTKAGTYDAKLMEEGLKVDEVVVTGYQKIDRKLFTGSASIVKAVETKVDGVADVSRMLEGKVAGVSVQNVSGTFGAAPKIRVRGASSIYGDTKPLWVVDGVVLEDVVDVSPDELSSGDAETLISSSVAGLNAEDIENYQILKDASATALYGARAMNGVIVITTKKGKAGRLNVNISSETTIKQKPSYNNYDILNSKEQMSVFQELERKGWLNYMDTQIASNGGVYYKMNNAIATYDPKAGAFMLPNTEAAKIDFLRKYELQNTDWFDELFKNGVTQNTAVSLNGGSEKASFYASASYLNDSGWSVADKVDRYTLRMRGDFKLNKKLSVSLLSNMSIREQRVPGAFGQSVNYLTGKTSRDFDINPFSYALNTSRTLTPYNEKGEYDYFRLNYADFNIIEELKNNYMDIELIDVNAQIKFKYKLNKYWNFDFDYSMRKVYNENTHKIHENSNVAKSYKSDGNATVRMLNKFLYQDPDNPNSEKQTVHPYGGFFLQDNNKLKNHYAKFLVNFNKTFNEVHSVNFLGGAEMKSVVRENTYFNGYGFLYSKGGTVFTDYKIMKQLIEANFDYYGNYVSKQRHAAAFANAGYGYKGKWIVNGTVRVDGSNQLGKSKSSRYLPTWNLSGKYNISEEDYFQSGIISQLSVRGTYGLTAIMGPAPNSTAILKNQIAIRQHSSDKEPEMKLHAVANDELTWEKQYETNIGFDLGLFNNRISLSSDIYFRKGFDLIAYIKTSAVGGQYWKTANYADMKSNGIEFSLNSKNIQYDDFSWNTNLTFAYMNSEITNIKNRPLVYDLVRSQGGPSLGHSQRSLFSIPFAGLTDQGIPTYHGEDGKITTGDISFQSSNVDYLKYEGPVDPTITGGLNNTFKYKNFRLKLFTSYSFGNKIRLNPTFSAVHNDWKSMTKDMKNRWLLPGDEKRTNIPVIPSKYQYKTIQNLGVGYSAYNFSDQRVAKGDFVRLKEVSLSYQMPKKLCAKLGVSSILLKGQATNVWLMYSDKKLNGQDPEFFGAGGVAMPIPKQYTFTLKLSI
ncbi:MAG: SusC/RagA family TonB-linked outer membrane protein [Marinifilaceae bacterium]|jgi:TonB-linked SusC/RagA family outer membrane protein|nr:SusC/RagA family TonB-linked outer membrane protein [Marinifilaceae bacterium]